MLGLSPNFLLYWFSAVWQLQCRRAELLSDELGFAMGLADPAMRCAKSTPTQRQGQYANDC